MLAPEKVAQPSLASEVLLARFERYLLVERGLVAASASQYAGHARRFLDGLPTDGGLDCVTASEVMRAKHHSTAPARRRHHGQHPKPPGSTRVFSPAQTALGSLQESRTPLLLWCLQPA